MEQHELKRAVGTAMHLLKRSENVSLGLNSLSVLLDHQSESGKDLDETLVKGLGVIVEGLFESLTSEANIHRAEMERLKLYSKQAFA
jgi:hypothetical protein